jgi:hypothetical protein
VALRSAPIDRQQPVQTPRPRLAVIRNMTRKQNRLPVVMASLKHAPQVQPLLSSTYLIIQSAEYTAAPAQDSRAGASAAGEKSVLQVQMFQVVRQDANGIQVQVFRLVMRVPAAMAMEGTARSI